MDYKEMAKKASERLQSFTSDELQEWVSRDNKKSAFFDLPKEPKVCRDPSHNPPGMILIPQGKGLRHVCPRCGQITEVIPQQYSL